MRHGKKFNHLGRKSAHRKAMLSNMACSLIEHKRINTTVAKARELRVYVEPLITRSKVDSTHNRRVVFSYLQNKEAVTELFREVSLKVGDRPGGYTRIIKTGNRLGDNADMAMIELVDYNEIYTKEKKTAKKSTRRRAGKTAEPKVAAPAKETAPAKEEAKAEETKVDEVTETPVEEVKAEATKEPVDETPAKEDDSTDTGEEKESE